MQYKQTNLQNKISHLFRAHNGNITKKIVFIRTFMSFSFHMWVKFVVGSLLRSERFFSGVLRFSSLSQKQTISNSNSTRNQVDEEPLCGCATSKSLFIYLFIYSWRSSPRWTFGCITYTGRTSILSDQMIRYVALQPWNGIKQTDRWREVSCCPRRK